MITETTPQTSITTTTTIRDDSTTAVSTQLTVSTFTSTITLATLSTVLFMHQLVTSLVIPFETIGAVSYWLLADGSRILWADGTAMRT